MKIQPLFDRVLVKQLQPNSKKTVSGFILPENTNERPVSAEVIAVGPGLENDDKITQMVLEVGDKVLFTKYVGVEFKFDDENFIIIKQTDVLAVIK